MRLVVLINSMGGGGAEKTVQTLISHWSSSHAFEHITIACLDPLEPVYEIPRDVKLYYLNSPLLTRALGRILTIPIQAYLLRRFLEAEGDVACVSFLARANLVHAFSKLLRNRVPVVLCEQTSTFDFFQDVGGLSGFFMPILIRALYPWADRVISASSAVSEALIEAGVSQAKSVVIHNPIPVEHFARLRGTVNRAKSGHGLITVGRLSPEKDQETLIRAFGIVVKTMPEAELTIVGTGSEETRLRELAHSLELNDRVCFAGWSAEPGELLVQADVFVLTSKSEGFGVVLAEAMACGLPVVCTDCPGGPREILQDGKSGILVPVGDHNALAEALVSLLSAPARRTHFEQQSLGRALDFGVGKIANQYYALLTTRVR